MPGEVSAQTASLFLAAAVLAVLQAIPEARAASGTNPCAETSVIRELMSNFNATPAAKSQHLAMVDVVQMTTVAQRDGQLVCRGIVFDSEGAKTPMVITISRNPAGHPSWSLRLDDAIHPAAMTS